MASHNSGPFIGDGLLTHFSGERGDTSEHEMLHAHLLHGERGRAVRLNCHVYRVRNSPLPPLTGTVWFR